MDPALSQGALHEIAVRYGGEHGPDLWIHGHTHDTIDRDLHGTRVVCNPSGYRQEYGTVFNLFGPKFVEVDTHHEE